MSEKEFSPLWRADLNVMCAIPHQGIIELRNRETGELVETYYPASKHPAVEVLDELERLLAEGVASRPNLMIQLRELRTKRGV